MRLATVIFQNIEQAAVIVGQDAFLVRDINRVEGMAFETSIIKLIQTYQLDKLRAWYMNDGKERLSTYPKMKEGDFTYTSLYREPKKILGVGMNYLEKARELSSIPPEKEPVSFLKPDSCLIGQDEPILLPPYSNHVTAEGELGIIIGRTCRNLLEHEVPNVIAGFTATLDMTAKDLHARNPRFLQISKMFDTFFSFGPQILTLDEVEKISELTVQTILNGEVFHSNEVENMMYHPWSIVSFFSNIMKLSPGDIIMTGTPGSVPITKGDVVECRISGFPVLRNPVQMD